ncbi:MAG: 2-C-methyl-D-erythritol 4-phosphate cytidylyltransferase, partial [Desulfobacterota bacterium]|nr:2-C-methyl-D-erythritol 4-phosphate cytidylyltransferase [Thermodesulfobacteriota bacterium]
GKGERLGQGPKGFLTINGKTLLKQVVDKLSKVVDRILVGVPSDFLKNAQDEVGGMAEVYPGGKSRQETIRLLFERTKEEIVVIWDVARPFASLELLKKIIEGAYKFSACGSFIRSHLPAFFFEDYFVISSAPAKKILLPQSPQAFRREVIEKAYLFAEEEGIEEQTTYELLLRSRNKIYIVEGEETNIKITTPFDWEIARLISHRL